MIGCEILCWVDYWFSVGLGNFGEKVVRVVLNKNGFRIFAVKDISKYYICKKLLTVFIGVKRILKLGSSILHGYK